MKVALIWDLDGTILDSYGIIVDSLYRIYHEKGVEIDKKEILRVCINESVSALSWIWKRSLMYHLTL